MRAGEQTFEKHRVKLGFSDSITAEVRLAVAEEDEMKRCNRPTVQRWNKTMIKMKNYLTPSFNSPFRAIASRGALFSILLFFAASCGEPGADPAFKAGGKAEPLSVSHSEGLRIEKTDDGFRVQVRNPRDTAEIYGTYHLSRRKQTSAGGDETVIRIPVQRTALNSTTFVPFFEKIDAHEVITGVSYANRVTNDRVKARIDAGEAIEIAGGDGIDTERLLMSAPDVLMAYMYNASDFSKIEDLGIPVIMNMEYAESTPLGRAEWVKLVGCLTDRYEEAEELFDVIARTYSNLRDLARDADYYPVVFSGSKYESKWFTPGNRSFVAQYIRDAGARYAFQHVEGQSNVELDFESVLSTLVKADYWGLIVSDNNEFKLSSLIRMEPQYALFKSFKEGQVFVCNTAKSDYFGDAVLEPHLVLADLIGILHPDRLPGHDFNYFRPVVVDVTS